jgi:hypothetical protein
MKFKKPLIIAAVLAATVLFGAESCDKANEPFKDADRGTTNDDKADTITFPDGFSNAATKCDHGNRVYVVFHGDSTYGSIAVVPNDPTCGEASAN